MITLRIISGPQKGKDFPLVAGENTIGRDPSSTIRLNSKTVSRHHASLLYDDTARLVEIRDNQSSNGVVVNGEKITQLHIVPGDTISIGEYRFQLIDPSAQPPDEHEQTHTRTQREKARSSSSKPPRLPRTVVTAWYARTRTFLKGLQWGTLLFLLIVAAFLLNHFLVITPIINRIAADLAAGAVAQGRLLAQNLAQHNQPSVAQENLLLLDCKSILNEPGVRKAFILNRDMKILCPPHEQDYIRDTLTTVTITEGRSSDNCDRIVSQGGEACSITAPIYAPSEFNFDAPRIVGAARILFAPAESQRTLQTLHYTSFKFLLITAILAALLFFLISRLTRRSVESLQDALYTTLSGSMAPIKASFPLRPLNDLLPPINSILERLQRLRETAGEESSISRAAPPSIRFAALSLGLSGNILITDTNTTVLAITNELADLLMLSAPESLTKPLKDVLNENDVAAEFLEAAQKAQDTPEHFASTTVVINGTPFTLNVRAVIEDAHQGFLFFNVM